MRQLSLVVLALALAAIMGGCGLVPQPQPPSAPIVPALSLELETPDGPAGLVRSGGLLRLVLFDGGQWTTVTSDPDRAGVTTVYLLSYGGETGRLTNSFVFGNAPAGSLSIRVSPGDGEGQVLDSVYLVALPLKDLGPADIHWVFVAGGGAIVEQGDGIRT